MVDMLQENLMKVLSIKEIFLEKLRDIDMFTQPMALTYQKSYKFSTIYGVIFTLATVALVIFISLDNVFFAKYRYVCPLTKNEPFFQTGKNISIKDQFKIFLALRRVNNV